MKYRVPTIDEYIFRYQPCGTGQIFLQRFNTLRDAWLSDEANPDHMLWVAQEIQPRFLSKKRNKARMDAVFKDMDDARYNLRSTVKLWTSQHADPTLVAHVVDMIWGVLAGYYGHPLIGLVDMFTELRKFKPVRQRRPVSGTEPARFHKELDLWEQAFRRSIRNHFPDMFISIW